MFRNNEFCEELIKYFKEEAIPKNYSDLIIKMDLDKKISSHTKYLEDWYNESLEDCNSSYDNGYDEGKEEGYEDGHYDGIKEGKEEGKKEFILLLADKLINLKNWLTNTDPSRKEIQIKLTELLLELDEDDNLAYTDMDIKLKEIDDIFCDD